MAWMADTYDAFHPGGIDNLACCTGKPVSQGGIAGRREATGHGVQYGIREAFQYKDDLQKVGLTPGLAGKTVAIQGFGNVGYHTAAFLSEEDGCRIIAILEWDGCVTTPTDSIFRNSTYIAERRARYGIFQGVKPSRAKHSGASNAIFSFPLALENQITLENCDRIRTKVLAEAANGPTTPAAGDALHKRGVMIIPDVFLNAGGVTVSYFEWGKNLSHMRFGSLQKHLEEIRNQRLVGAIGRMVGKDMPEVDRKFFTHGPEEIDLVNSGLEETMIRAYRAIREMHLTRAPQESLRIAAFMIAIEKVAITYELLGIFP
jgi:glutamate dehydrogenase (NAD(P)+)